MMSNFGLGQGFGPITSGGGGSAPVGATLAIADNADGTGAVATIAGTDAGAANSVDVYAFSGSLADLGDVQSFTRTGNGTRALALATGSYFAVLKSDDFLAADPVFFRVTDAEQCLWDEIIDAVVLLIQGLPLSGLTADMIRRGKIPAKFADIGTAGVLVCPVKETIGTAGNRKDNLGYGVMVSCFKASNGDNYTNLGTELKWRDQIETAFKIKPAYNPLSTVAEVYNIAIEPGSVVLPEAFFANYDVGSIVLRVFAKQSR